MTHQAARIVVLLMSFFVINSAQQAPGDEDELCLSLPSRPPVVNQEILMWSRSYRDLLERDAPWIVLDEDNNNDGTSTTVSQGIVQLFTLPLVSSTSQLAC